MSTIAGYPDSVSVAGPYATKLNHNPIAYEVDVFRNEDGGADVNVQPCGILRFEIEYDGITAAEVETLRAHWNLAKGKVNDFPFRSRYDGATYNKCTYEKFEIPPHVKTWSNQVRVSLITFT